MNKTGNVSILQEAFTNIPNLSQSWLLCCSYISPYSTYHQLFSSSIRLGAPRQQGPYFHLLNVLPTVHHLTNNRLLRMYGE